jgi:hypothetical protein
MAGGAGCVNPAGSIGNRRESHYLLFIGYGRMCNAHMEVIMVERDPFDAMPIWYVLVRAIFVSPLEWIWDKWMGY